MTKCLCYLTLVTIGHSCDRVAGHGDIVQLVHGDQGGAHAEAGPMGHPRLHCEDLLGVQLLPVLDPVYHTGVVFPTPVHYCRLIYVTTRNNDIPIEQSSSLINIKLTKILCCEWYLND